MKRTVKDGKLWYVKTGGGSLVIYLDGKPKMIKPGQKFLAHKQEVPEAFSDTIHPVDPVAEVTVEKEEVEEKLVKPVYDLNHKGGGWYDIVDGDGKVVNERPLKKDTAQEFLNTLS